MADQLPASSTARVIAVGAPPTFRQLVARALNAGVEQVEWIPTVTAVEEWLSDRSKAAEVLVLSPTIKDLDAFGLAQFLGRTSPATAVVLVREHPGNGLLPPAMRAGIRDVVDLSKGGEELREALERAVLWSRSLRSMGPTAVAEATGPRGIVVSIFSSKGGTGKTFLTSNLGVALAAKTGGDVAVVDADLDLGDVFSYFGQESNMTLPDLVAIGDLTDREAVIAAATELSPHVYGFAATPEPGAEPVSGEAMANLIRCLRGFFPFTVVDASANYSDEALATFDLSDSIILVTGLDIVGLRHLSSALRTLLSLGVPRERFRVVLNRADSKVGLEPDEVARIMRLSIDTLIPSSRLVPISLNRGRPVYLSAPKSGVTQSVGGLADRIVALSPQASQAAAAPAHRGRLGRRARKS
jgi:pilus assembly protein CpaE